jgi:hypothetical protein
MRNNKKKVQTQWPRGLRHEPSSPARTPGSWVRIPIEAWMSVCVYYVFVLFCVQIAALRRADPRSKKSSRLCIGLTNWEGRAIAQAVSRWLPTAAAWVQTRVVMWDLWWTKWRWDRFSPSTSVSLANLHSTNFSTITITYHPGLVQSASSGRRTQSPTPRIKKNWERSQGPKGCRAIERERKQNNHRLNLLLLSRASSFLLLRGPPTVNSALLVLFYSSKSV